jgi:hypothetical protein
VASVSAREEGRARTEASASSSLPAPYRTTASFVTALRRDDAHALRQLFLFYSPLLRDEGRRMGLGPGDRREVATTVLDDVGVH